MILEYQKLNVNGKFTEASDLIESARKKYPHDYRIMNTYMWDKAGGKVNCRTEKLINNQKEFTQICDCILEGCKREDLRIEAINMKAKLQHAVGDTESALETLSQLSDWQAHMVTEQLFAKDTPEFHYWITRNYYGLVNVMAIKHARVIWFDQSFSVSEKTVKLESVAETYSEISQKNNFEPFLIGEEAVYAFLADILTVNSAAVEEIIRIREKQFISIEKLMKLAESDEILYESIKRTYKTDNMIIWAVNRLLNFPKSQFVGLRENSKYMEMLAKWKKQSTAN